MLEQKNKKALSEIVAYVLLIVISLALASGVYVWLKAYVPNERQTCSEDISLSVKTYSCNITEKLITLTIENKGFFATEGFFIRGGTEQGKLPAIMLAQNDPLTTKGRYDFKDGKLYPQATETMSFRYVYSEQNVSASPLKRIQIQPYTVSNKTKTLLLCDTGIINLDVTGCD